LTAKTRGKNVSKKKWMIDSRVARSWFVGTLKLRAWSVNKLFPSFVNPLIH
jgi:hypothetical protein